MLLLFCILESPELDTFTKYSNKIEKSFKISEFDENFETNKNIIINVCLHLYNKT